jgi:hypothetical protein
MVLENLVPGGSESALLNQYKALECKARPGMKTA